LVKSGLPHDEPEAVDLDPGVLARRLDAPATVKAVLEQGEVRGVAEQLPRFLRNFAEGTEDHS
jgi:hypothetical protein